MCWTLFFFYRAYKLNFFDTGFILYEIILCQNVFYIDFIPNLFDTNLIDTKLLDS
jgi:hypothetical protein